MATRREREQFFTQMARLSVAVALSDVRAFLRYSTTLQRLAEAQCNGDWPADNGTRKVEACTECEGLWAPSVLLKGRRCPDCRTSELARDLAKSYGMTAHFQGDPRGCVFALHVGECGDGCKWGNYPQGHTVICVP